MKFPGFNIELDFNEDNFRIYRKIATRILIPKKDTVLDKCMFKEGTNNEIILVLYNDLDGVEDEDKYSLYHKPH